MLLLAVFALTLIGLVMVYSASSANLVSEGSSPYKDVVGQLIFVCVGVVCAVIVWRIPPRAWLSRLLWVVWGAAMVLLVLTAFFGVEEYGAKRWLAIGSFTIQPSEYIKIALLLLSVRIVYNYHEGKIELRAGVLQGLLCVLLPLVVLYKTQSDLGTAVICAVGIIAVMWFGGVKKSVLGVVCVLGIAVALVAVVMTGYRNDRLVFVNPWNDGMNGYGTGYQIIRGYYAIAEGGILGVGLGNSHEKYQYLFASDSDYIFAIIGEELGMIGALAVIALFLLVLYAGLRIAETSPDGIGFMLAGGCTVMLVFQAFLNIGCVVGVFPTTGKPLPFISQGGSSVIASMILVGLIMSVSRAAGEPSIYERRRADLRIVRAAATGAGGSRPSDRSYARRRGAEAYNVYRGGSSSDACVRVQGARMPRASSSDFARLTMPRSSDARRASSRR